MEYCKINVTGLENAYSLIKKHYSLLEELKENLDELRNVYPSLNITFNEKPPAATDGLTKS